MSKSFSRFTSVAASGLLALFLTTPVWAGPIGYSITRGFDFLMPPVPSELRTIDLMTGVVTTVGPTGVTGEHDFEGLDFSPSGELFASEDSGGDIYRINVATGAATLVGNTGLDFLGNSGLAFRSDGTLFLITDGGGEDGARLYTVNTATGAATVVGDLTLDTLSSIAFAPDGTLFAIDPDNDFLVTINPTTAAISNVGVLGLGVAIDDQQGLDFDSSGTLFLMSENPFAVYTVDTTTGVATLSTTLTKVFPGPMDEGFIDFESLAIPTARSSAIPAPGTLALLGLGLLGLGAVRRRGRRA